MKTEILNSFTSLGKDAVASTKELVDINAKLMNRALESQIGFAQLWVAGSEKQLEVAKSAGDVKDYVAAQTALVEEFAAKLTEAAQANAAFAQQVSEELKAWFEKSVEKGVKSADEAVKEVVKQAKAA